MERLALASAAPRYKHDPTLLDSLDRLIGTMEKAASRLEWIDVSKADLSFHREICRVSGNQIVLTLWVASEIVCQARVITDQTSIKL